MEDKIRFQSKATEKYCETIFPGAEGVGRELERSLGTRSEKHILVRCQSERERARMLQRLGGLRSTGHGSDARDTLSFESCSSSMASDMEQVSAESSKRMKDMDETTSEAAWTALTNGKEKEVCSLEPEGEAEKSEAMGLGSEVKGISVNPEGESSHRHGRAKRARKEKEHQTRMEKGYMGRHLGTRVRRFRVRREKLCGWNLKRRRIM